MATATACTPLLFDLIESNNTEHDYPNKSQHFWTWSLPTCSSFRMLEPRHNLLPLCNYRKQCGKCKGVDTNPTHDRCCQDLEVLVLLLLTSLLLYQPLLVAEPGKSNLSQPSAARADSHRPRHPATHIPQIHTNSCFFAWQFPRYGHINDKTM